MTPNSENEGESTSSRMNTTSSPIHFHQKSIVEKEEKKILFPQWISDSALPRVDSEEGLRAITFTSHHHHGIVQKITITEIWTVVFTETKRDIVETPPTPPLFSCSRLRHYDT